MLEKTASEFLKPFLFPMNWDSVALESFEEFMLKNFHCLSGGNHLY